METMWERCDGLTTLELKKNKKKGGGVISLIPLVQLEIIHRTFSVKRKVKQSLRFLRPWLLNVSDRGCDWRISFQTDRMKQKTASSETSEKKDFKCHGIISELVLGHGCFFFPL